MIRNFPRQWNQLFVYVKLSAVVYGATALATKSLAYPGVTYVTKVVFKSAKLIPTMLVGVIMDARAINKGNTNVKRHNYTVWDYGSALLLCIGAAGFCMSPKDSSDSSDENLTTTSNNTAGPHWIGISLLIGSVFCDAFVPNISEQLMQQGPTNTISSMTRKDSGEDLIGDEEVELKSLLASNSGPINNNNIHHDNNATAATSKKKKDEGGLSSASLMVNTNSIGFVLLFLSTVISSQLIPIVSFMAVHPHFLLLHLTVGCGLGTAVLAYTELIKRSGPAFAVAVATLRKVVTVVLSYIIFPKAMTITHLASSCLVLAGIVVGFAGKRRSRRQT